MNWDLDSLLAGTVPRAWPGWKIPLAILIVVAALLLTGCATTASLTFESAGQLNYESGVGVQIETEDADQLGLGVRTRSKVTTQYKNDGTNSGDGGYTYALGGGVIYNFPNAFAEVGYEYYGYRTSWGADLNREDWVADDNSMYYRAGLRGSGATMALTYYPPAGTIYDANTLMLTYSYAFAAPRDGWIVFIEPSFTTLTVPATGERDMRSAVSLGLGYRFK